MSTTGRRTLAAAIALAAMLIAPSVASAKIFTVSRDVTIYETADRSNPLRTYPAGGRVDVRCYAKGEAIDGYAVWDRIRNGNDGFGYVHDKYVEMPNGGDPAANGIISCDGSEPLPPVGTCARGPFITRYLSEKVPVLADHSHAKLTWQPRMCRDSDGWVLRNEPKLNAMAAGEFFGIGVDLDAVRVEGETASYHGQIKLCQQNSISYKGVSFSASSCRSVGTVDIAATVRNGKIATPDFASKDRGVGDYLWTRDVL